tara:strand:- start:798 stop:953 length:156 start_codon:yes stop_codon:yes gene_type:complete
MDMDYHPFWSILLPLRILLHIDIENRPEFDQTLFSIYLDVPDIFSLGTLYL